MAVSVIEAFSVGSLTQGKVLAGARNLDNVIEHIDVIESPFQESWDAKNCLFLTSFYASVNNIQEQIRTIEKLYANGCSALCFQAFHLPELDAAVIRRAEELGLPLIQIPASISYSKIITSVTKTLHDKKTHQLLPNQDAYQKLMRGVGLDGSLDDIAKALAEFVAYPVVIIDSAGRILSGRFPEDLVPDLENVIEYISSLNQPVTNTYWAADYQLWLLPVFSEDKLMVDAYLVVSDPEKLLDESDIVYLEQAANIVSFHLMARKQEKKSRKQLKKILIENLMTGNFDSTEIIVNQAKLLGWNIENKRLIILIHLSNLINVEAQRSLTCKHNQSIREQVIDIVTQVVREYEAEDIYFELDDHIVIMPTTDDGVSKMELRKRFDGLVKKIYSKVCERIGEIDLPITIGSFHETIVELCESYNEAMSSVNYCHRLNSTENIVWYDDIEAFQILESVYLQNKISKWVVKTLGKLIDYDQINNTELVKTFETYLDTNQKLQQTAEKLFIHPKTLKYRLQRICDILERDPFTGEYQFNYYLACKIFRLSQIDK